MAVQRGAHPSADTLKAFGLGKLDDSSSGVVLDHIDQCADCRHQVTSLSGDDFVKRLRQARSRTSTPAPAKSLSDVSRAEKVSAVRTPIANLPPELVNNPQYEIVRELGRGGMGVVYLAKNKLMERLEVLKVVNKALLDHPAAVERFLREIRAAAKLSHANVVGAYSAVQFGELLAFAMEYIEGQDLASLVKSQGPLPIAHACYYIQQAASGLQHAFEKGMVHRDIKPQNLILAREGKKHIVKVLDFGLAKATREKKDDTGLTGEGKMLGTPDYIAPEQTLDAAKADIRADIYSLGCTLYYLLAGHPPFSADSLGAILLAHQSQEPRTLTLVRPEVPEELAAVVRKMMAKPPAKRYQTPQEVAQVLTPFIKQGAAQKRSLELSLGSVAAKPAERTAAQVGRPPAHETQEAEKAKLALVWESLGERNTASVGPSKSEMIRRPRAAIVSERGSQKKWLAGGGLAVVVLAMMLLGMWAVDVFKERTPKLVQNVEPGEKPSDQAQVKPRVELSSSLMANTTEKQLEDLVVSGSVWRGTVHYASVAELTKQDWVLVLYVQRRSGPSFAAIEATYLIKNGVCKDRFLRSVEGDVKGAVVDYHSKPGQGDVHVNGNWANGCLEYSYENMGGKGTGKLKPENAGPKPAEYIVSLFGENDCEGWHTLNDDETANATKPIQVHSLAKIVGNGQDNFFWLFANPIPNNQIWGWHAPDKFHGDHSGKFGRHLIYAIYVGSSRKPPSKDRYVVLQGAGKTLYLDGSVMEPPAPHDWKYYFVKLDPSYGWKKDPDGERASDTDMKEVLSDITDLRIMGEFGCKFSGCLHRVEFGAVDPFEKE